MMNRLREHSGRIQTEHGKMAQTPSGPWGLYQWLVTHIGPIIAKGEDVPQPIEVPPELFEEGRRALITRLCTVPGLSTPVLDEALREAQQTDTYTMPTAFGRFVLVKSKVQ